jgi:1-acyl-sn-glycerol-3-phosphate acyltransferase
VTRSASTSDRCAAVGRAVGRSLIYGMWNARVLGAWRVPATGPVILAVNHTHYVDGPVLMGLAPRPVHFLIKQEAFAGLLGVFLRAIGQLSVDRGAVDRAAVQGALRVLDEGKVLGIFPEGTRRGDFARLRAGLTYFAVRSGAPVVPVAVLGSTDTKGRLIHALPALRSRVDIVFGEPFQVGDGTGRRTRAALGDATVTVQERLTSHLKQAKQLTGR